MSVSRKGPATVRIVIDKILNVIVVLTIVVISLVMTFLGWFSPSRRRS
jgi:hypothetical protein